MNSLSLKKEYIAVILLFLVLSILFTWPLVLHLHNGILGESSDPLLNTWIISWDAKTIFTNPSNLFAGNIMYPSRDVLVYSEHLFTLGLLAVPFYYLSGNPILTYNLLLLLGLAFTAFACYLLIKELTGSRWGALAGGVFFAFCPFKLSKLGHIQILIAPFLPLMLLYLYRYLKKGGRKNILLFGLFFLAQSLLSWHYLVFCSLTAGLLWAWYTAFSHSRERWLRLAFTALAALVVLALILPFALPYLRAYRRLPDFERTLAETDYYSATVGDYLRVHPESLLYGGAPSPFRQRAEKPEDVLYPGIIVIVLALAGVFIRRRKKDTCTAFDPDSFRLGALFFLALTTLAVLLTFGPMIGNVSNYLYTVPYHLGIFKFIRFPGRFYVLVALGLSVLAGYGVAKISIRVSGWRGNLKAGRITAAILVVLLLLELATFNFVVYEVPVWGDVPEVYVWLEDQKEARVIELPASPLTGGAYRYDNWNMGYVPQDLLSNIYREGLSVYFSIYNWQRLANGYSGYLPFFYRHIFTEMQAFPSQRSMELLQGLDIDLVIWHWDRVEEGEKKLYQERLSGTPGLFLEREFGDTAVYRVEPVSNASTTDLLVSPLSPQAVPGGEGFNCGLMVMNGSPHPYVYPDENPRSILVSFIDETGNVVCEERGEYRTPFFLQPGEETSLPFEVITTPPPGNYHMRLELVGGALEGRSFELDLAILEAGVFERGGALDGTVYGLGDGYTVDIAAPDGLYPLMLRVENNGDTLWRSRWSEEQVTEEYPLGLVYLGLNWTQADEAVWEEQGAVLPCDLSPGQSMEVPILIRPPDTPGSYNLVIGLREKIINWFGGYTVVEVSVR